METGAVVRPLGGAGGPTLPPVPGGLVYGAMDLADLAYWIDLPACLRCLRYSGGTDFCELCRETLTREALGVSQNAPPVDWQLTLLGEYQALLDDSHTARVYSVPSLGTIVIALEDNSGVRVCTTCPDLDTGRRYAECAHWLMHRIKEKRSLTLPTPPTEAPEFATCDLADLAFWLAQADPEPRTFPYP